MTTQSKPYHTDMWVVGNNLTSHLWPWPWPDDLDIWTWPRYCEHVKCTKSCWHLEHRQNGASLDVPVTGQMWQTDRQTDTIRHITTATLATKAWVQTVCPEWCCVGRPCDWSDVTVWTLADDEYWIVHVPRPSSHQRDWSSYESSEHW